MSKRPRDNSASGAGASTARGRTVAIVLVLILAVVGIGWLASSGVDSELTTETRNDRRVMPVGTLTAKASLFYEVTRTFTGTVNARRASDLAFERSAKLSAIKFDAGDRITLGDEIAVLDQRLLVTQQQRLQAQKRAADARLDELKNGPRQETKDAAEAELEALIAQSESDAIAFERQKELRQSRAITSDEFDRIRLAVAASRARVEAARERWNELNAGTRQEQIDAQQAVVDELAAALAEVAVQIKQSTMIAPFTGTVTSRFLDEGTIVSPQTPVIRIVEDAELEVHIGVPIGFVEQVDVGSEHTLKVDGTNVAVTVMAVLPEVDRQTRTRTAILRPAKERDGNQNQPAVVDGQLARIELTQRVEQSGFWLPMAALTRSTRGLWSVYAVVDDTENDGSFVAERREVEVLHTTGDRVFVRGTIRAGDRIINAGLQRIVPGQLVTIADNKVNDRSE